MMGSRHEGRARTMQPDSECECGSGLPAQFWTGDGWMCGECYDEREADRDLERAE